MLATPVESDDHRREREPHEEAVLSAPVATSTGVSPMAGAAAEALPAGARATARDAPMAEFLRSAGDDKRAETVLAMQRAIGNRAVTRALNPFAQQLSVSPASPVLARQGAKQIDKPGSGKGDGKASQAELDAEAEMLALLEASVTAADTPAQKARVDRLGEIVATMPFWQAEALVARLSKPARSDRLATEFNHRLSTETRQVLLGRLSARVATKKQFFSPQQDPRTDPKYVDNVLEEVRCWLLYADRYTVVFTGGRKVVVNDDIDWKKTSTTIPVVDIQRDESTARAAVTEWHDVALAGHYDRAVAFYHGPGGVVLPTWFSPETAPATYRLIMGVNASLREQARDIEEEFRQWRNGIAIGVIAGGVLKFMIRAAPGGGGFGRGRLPPLDPIPDPIPDPVGGKPVDPAGVKPPADPAGGAKPPADPVGAKPPSDPAGAKPPAGTQPPGTTTTPDVVADPAPAPVEPAVPAKMDMRARLTKYYERLAGKPQTTNANDALRQLSDTLDEIEDMYSGVPKKSPPPPPDQPDGRMYPPLEDFIKRQPDGSLSARTKAHRIVITPDGKITITSVRTGQVEFTKP